MKAVYKKITALIALMLAGLMALSGCGSAAEVMPEMELSSYVPQKGEEGASFTAQLYFLSDDGLHFSMEERTIEYDGDASRAEAAVRALIEGPRSTVLKYSVPRGMGLQRVDTSYEACNVYLLASHMPEAREWLSARAAIAATVFACEDIATVNLYLNGMAVGYYGRPLGAMQPIATTLDAYITAIQQEYKEIWQSAATEAGIYENRTATLYFTDSTNTLLIAKNTTLNYDSTESYEAIASLLVNKLMGDAGELYPVLPDGFELIGSVSIQPLETENQPDDDNPEEGDAPHPDEMLPGENLEEEDPEMKRGEPSIITLNIREPEVPYDIEMMCGALTLTLTGYIPDIQGVAINMIGADGRPAAVSDGYYTRDDFSHMIGRIVHIAYPDADGTVMYRVPRAMSSKDSYDPQRILNELFAGPAERGVMYTHLSEKDIADVYITGSTVVVDWKEGFEAALRQYINSTADDIPADKRERMFVYSVVNTLTELEGVSKVWMLENGKKLGRVNEIYLGNALMRNPGILVDD